MARCVINMDCYVCERLPYCKCFSTGRLLGTYNLGVATPRALVHAGDKTSGDARSWYMISGDAKCVLIKVNGWFWRLKLCTLGDLGFNTKTKDHPLEQVIGEPSRPVLISNQLRSDGDMCMYALTVSTMEPKNVKEAMTDPVWIESMQEELLQFKRLDLWVLVAAPDNIKPLTL
ncbi:hypothetical protein Tco_0832085 [Tanacetum coccineum]